MFNSIKKSQVCSGTCPPGTASQPLEISTPPNRPKSSNQQPNRPSVIQPQPTKTKNSITSLGFQPSVAALQPTAGGHPSSPCHHKSFSQLFTVLSPSPISIKHLTRANQPYFFHQMILKNLHLLFDSRWLGNFLMDDQRLRASESSSKFWIYEMLSLLVTLIPSMFSFTLILNLISTTYG